jgi:hypothetical protein
LITVTTGSSREGVEREVSDIKKIIIIINKSSIFFTSGEFTFLV